MKENDAMRPISNERPEVSNKVLTDDTTCLKDIHPDFLFMFLHEQVFGMQNYFTY